MKITAMDINEKEFKKIFRGYDIDEVDEFLDKVGEDYEEIYKENTYLKEKINSLNEQIEHYKKMEDTIKNTILLAQTSADQARQSAQKEADLIMEKANQAAQKVLDKANNDVMQIKDEYESTKQEFIIFRTKFKNFMKTQMEMFNDMEKDFIKHYNIGCEVMDNEENNFIKEKDIEMQTNLHNADSKKTESSKKDIEVQQIEEDLNKITENTLNVQEEEFSEEEKFSENNSLDEIKNFFVK
ncbi:septum site-determining protein DivIVA [Clostridium acetireducens DSM 10703]|uniref:Septum site-determining protein DivIVA n=1 Tax=Clostridium acetireducens DSM 10703 TaxID=1121290 RepID=A0A1E8F1S9_9CLOT|nr:DivIVA domain-containing protein [Clostridium acetireducens]OFI07560.1 septum site-determining protein DivIVA [Clostridium acetireducens DSM 10703]